MSFSPARRLYRTLEPHYLHHHMQPCQLIIIVIIVITVIIITGSCDVVMCSVVFVCQSVCPVSALTFESFDLETSFCYADTSSEYLGHWVKVKVKVTGGKRLYDIYVCLCAYTFYYRKQTVICVSSFCQVCKFSSILFC